MDVRSIGFNDYRLEQADRDLESLGSEDLFTSARGARRHRERYRSRGMEDVLEYVAKNGEVSKKDMGKILHR